MDSSEPADLWIIVVSCLEGEVLMWIHDAEQNQENLFDFDEILECLRKWFGYRIADYVYVSSLNGVKQKGDKVVLPFINRLMKATKEVKGITDRSLGHVFLARPRSDVAKDVMISYRGDIDGANLLIYQTVLSR